MSAPLDLMALRRILPEGFELGRLSDVDGLYIWRCFGDTKASQLIGRVETEENVSFDVVAERLRFLMRHIVGG